MALKAGYQGIKDVGDGLKITTDGVLELTGEAAGVTPNPEGEATEALNKIEIDDTIYSVGGADLSKCYQTTDDTESAIVDADYIPFLDSSAASGAGAPKKSTWSNFISKVQAKLTKFLSYEDNGILGAKNFLKNNAVSGSSAGVSFTVNSDGTVTASRTASSDNYATLSVNDNLFNELPKDTDLIASGGVETGVYYYINGSKNNTFVRTYAEVKGTDVPFSIPSYDDVDKIYATIRVNSDKSPDAAVFRPMVRIAGDSDTTYVPYAMTNRELTEKKPITITAETGGTFTNVDAFKCGNFTKVSATYTFNTSVSSGTVKIGSIDRFKPMITIHSMVVTGSSTGSVFINSSGDIYFRYLQGSDAFTDLNFNIIY